jgi:hypothetical protein
MWTSILHFLQFNYDTPGAPWYKAADWPNVFVLLPLVVLTIIHSEWRHSKLHARMDKIAESHKAILLLLDPDAEDSPWQDVLDRLDPATPSGIGEIIARLDQRTTA